MRIVAESFRRSGGYLAEKERFAFESDRFIQGAPCRVPYVNDPDISVLYEIMNAIWISRDKATAKFRIFCVANSEVGSADDQCSRVKNRPTDAICSRRVSLAMYSMICRRSSRARGVIRSVMNR